MQLPTSERRRRRSYQTYTAVGFQLEHLVDTLGLRAICLGDDRGLTLAGAGDDDKAEILAAFAPLLASCTDRRRRERILETIGRYLPDLDPDLIDVRPFTLSGATYFLALAGDDRGRAAAGLYHALTGVRRIFGETCSPLAVHIARARRAN